MEIYILGYRGISLVSRLIRWQTRSVYSHVAIEIDGITYEAWHKGGVQKCSWRTNHTPGTQVDVMQIRAPYDEDRLLAFCEAQVGKAYDFRGVLRFLSRRPVPADDRWFCSEHTGAGFLKARRPLQNMPPSYLSPRDVMMTPWGSFVEARTV